MNKVVDFSDTLADRWDELCYHDPEKLNDILRRTGLRKGLRILDIGCGTGVLESYLLPYSPLQIVGVDISPGMIEKARSKYATPIVDFRCQDVRDIRGKSFDYIIAYSVFPHFQEPEKLISHLAGLLPVNWWSATAKAATGSTDTMTSMPENSRKDCLPWKNWHACYPLSSLSARWKTVTDSI